MTRMNDSQRWLKVAHHFKTAFFNEKGICIYLRSMKQDRIINAATVERMERQLWRAARKGQLRGAIKHVVNRGFGYIWPPRQGDVRVAAARKLSRLVKR